MTKSLWMTKGSEIRDPREDSLYKEIDDLPRDTDKKGRTASRTSDMIIPERKVTDHLQDHSLLGRQWITRKESSLYSTCVFFSDLLVVSPDFLSFFSHWFSLSLLSICFSSVSVVSLGCCIQSKLRYSLSLVIIIPEFVPLLLILWPSTQFMVISICRQNNVLSWPRYKWPFADWVKAVVVGWTEGSYITHFLFYCLCYQLSLKAFCCVQHHSLLPSVSPISFPLHLLVVNVCVGHLLSRDLFYVSLVSVVVCVCFGYFII